MSKNYSYKITLTATEISSIHEVLTWYLNELKKTKIDKETVVPCCEDDRDVAFEQAKQSLKNSKERTKILLRKLHEKSV